MQIHVQSEKAVLSMRSLPVRGSSYPLLCKSKPAREQGAESCLKKRPSGKLLHFHSPYRAGNAEFAAIGVCCKGSMSPRFIISLRISVFCWLNIKI
jgi:hypothetical protein